MAVGAVDWWCASCPLANGSCWLGPCPSAGSKMLTLPWLPVWRLPATPFVHEGLVPAFSLRCFACKATLVLLNENWTMGAEGFGRKKPFAFCPAVLTGSCCIKLQVQSYAHLGGNFCWRKSITRKRFKTAGKAFISFPFPVLKPVWIRKIGAI